MLGRKLAIFSAGFFLDLISAFWTPCNLNQTQYFENTTKEGIWRAKKICHQSWNWIISEVRKFWKWLDWTSSNSAIEHSLAWWMKCEYLRKIKSLIKPQKRKAKVISWRHNRFFRPQNGPSKKKVINSSQIHPLENFEQDKSPSMVRLGPLQQCKGISLDTL